MGLQIYAHSKRSLIYLSVCSLLSTLLSPTHLLSLSLCCFSSPSLHSSLPLSLCLICRGSPVTISLFLLHLIMQCQKIKKRLFQTRENASSQLRASKGWEKTAGQGLFSQYTVSSLCLKSNQGSGSHPHLKVMWSHSFTPCAWAVGFIFLDLNMQTLQSSASSNAEHFYFSCEVLTLHYLSGQLY